jgi:hypothetical protein
MLTLLSLITPGLFTVTPQLFLFPYALIRTLELPLPLPVT